MTTSDKMASLKAQIAAATAEQTDAFTGAMKLVIRAADEILDAKAFHSPNTVAHAIRSKETLMAALQNIEAVSTRDQKPSLRRVS